MFRDDMIELKLNTYMPNHRKIVYYKFDSNLSDLSNIIEENEHGTYVAGTVAGKSICSNDEKKMSYFNGNAPDSKILYTGHFNEFDSSKLPIDMIKYNSKLSTNSWATETPSNKLNFEFGQMAA